MDLTVLPTVNASLNALATTLLVAGLIAIKQDKKELHKRIMQTAVGVTVLFLFSYVVYHLNYGSTKFTGTGWVRPVYFFILITHVILAAVNVPLVGVTLWRAHKEDWDAHRRIARWAWPVWMYVGVTGVLVYLMLYVWFPGRG
ncbi:MAG: DUF420 domain-containing protein [Planctomycetota bacterium]|nr:DUF420 domain-containing protein [Planctomycetota bacterium]